MVLAVGGGVVFLVDGRICRIKARTEEEHSLRDDEPRLVGIGVIAYDL